jgi:flagellar hook-length control protein FliK
MPFFAGSTAMILELLRIGASPAMPQGMLPSATAEQPAQQAGFNRALDAALLQAKVPDAMVAGDASALLSTPAFSDPIAPRPFGNSTPPIVTSVYAQDSVYKPLDIKGLANAAQTLHAEPAADISVDIDRDAPQTTVVSNPIVAALLDAGVSASNAILHKPEYVHGDDIPEAQNHSQIVEFALPIDESVLDSDALMKHAATVYAGIRKALTALPAPATVEVYALESAPDAAKASTQIPIQMQNSADAKPASIYTAAKAPVKSADIIVEYVQQDRDGTTQEYILPADKTQSAHHTIPDQQTGIEAEWKGIKGSAITAMPTPAMLPADHVITLVNKDITNHARLAQADIDQMADRNTAAEQRLFTVGGTMVAMPADQNSANAKDKNSISNSVSAFSSLIQQNALPAAEMYSFANQKDNSSVSAAPQSASSISNQTDNKAISVSTRNGSVAYSDQQNKMPALDDLYQQNNIAAGGTSINTVITDISNPVVSEHITLAGNDNGDIGIAQSDPGKRSDSVIINMADGKSSIKGDSSVKTDSVYVAPAHISHPNTLAEGVIKASNPAVFIDDVHQNNNARIKQVDKDSPGSMTTGLSDFPAELSYPAVNNSIAESQVIISSEIPSEIPVELNPEFIPSPAENVQPKAVAGKANAIPAAPKQAQVSVDKTIASAVIPSGIPVELNAEFIPSPAENVQPKVVAGKANAIPAAPKQAQVSEDKSIASAVIPSEIPVELNPEFIPSPAENVQPKAVAGKSNAIPAAPKQAQVSVDKTIASTEIPSEIPVELNAEFIPSPAENVQPKAVAGKSNAIPAAPKQAQVSVDKTIASTEIPSEIPVELNAEIIPSPAENIQPKAVAGKSNAIPAAPKQAQVSVDKTIASTEIPSETPVELNAEIIPSPAENIQPKAVAGKSNAIPAAPKQAQVSVDKSIASPEIPSKIPVELNAEIIPSPAENIQPKEVAGKSNAIPAAPKQAQVSVDKTITSTEIPSEIPVALNAEIIPSPAENVQPKAVAGKSNAIPAAPKQAQVSVDKTIASTEIPSEIPVALNAEIIPSPAENVQPKVIAGNSNRIAAAPKQAQVSVDKSIASTEIPSEIPVELNSEFIPSPAENIQPKAVAGKSNAIPAAPKQAQVSVDKTIASTVIPSEIPVELNAEIIPSPAENIQPKAVAGNSNRIAAAPRQAQTAENPVIAEFNTDLQAQPELPSDPANTSDTNALKEQSNQKGNENIPTAKEQRNIPNTLSKHQIDRQSADLVDGDASSFTQKDIRVAQTNPLAQKSQISAPIQNEVQPIEPKAFVQQNKAMEAVISNIDAAIPQTVYTTVKQKEISNTTLPSVQAKADQIELNSEFNSQLKPEPEEFFAPQQQVYSNQKDILPSEYNQNGNIGMPPSMENANLVAAAAQQSAPVQVEKAAKAPYKAQISNISQLSSFIESLPAGQDIPRIVFRISIPAAHTQKSSESNRFSMTEQTAKSAPKTEILQPVNQNLSVSDISQNASPQMPISPGGPISQIQATVPGSTEVQAGQKPIAQPAVSVAKDEAKSMISGNGQNIAQPDIAAAQQNNRSGRTEKAGNTNNAMSAQAAGSYGVALSAPTRPASRVEKPAGKAQNQNKAASPISVQQPVMSGISSTTTAQAVLAGNGIAAAVQPEQESAATQLPAAAMQSAAAAMPAMRENRIAPGTANMQPANMAEYSAAVQQPEQNNSSDSGAFSGNEQQDQQSGGDTYAPAEKALSLEKQTIATENTSDKAIGFSIPREERRRIKAAEHAANSGHETLNAASFPAFSPAPATMMPVIAPEIPYQPIVPAREFAQYTGSRLAASRNIEQVNSVTMKLAPQELGQVTVAIDMQQSNATLRIEVENQAARQTVEAQLPQLREQLMQQGIRVEKSDIVLRPASAEQNQQQNAENKGGQMNNNSQSGQENARQQRQGQEQRQAFVRSFRYLQEEQGQTAAYKPYENGFRSAFQS